MTEHPRAELSAFIDDELDASARAAVEAHVAGCAHCARRVDDLRSTARLLAALPDPLPSRSLLPRISAAPVWLRPARTLATLASGTFVFVFMASAILTSGTGLGGGSDRRSPPFFGPGGAPAAEVTAERGVPAAASAPAVGGASPAADQLRQSSPSPGTFTATPGAAVALSERVVEGRSFGPPPWVWFALAVFSGALALALHRRLRRT